MMEYYFYKPLAAWCLLSDTTRSKKGVYCRQFLTAKFLIHNQFLSPKMSKKTPNINSFKHFPEITPNHHI